MEISLKDGVAIVVYLITVVSLWTVMRKDINTNAKDIKALSKMFEKVMFGDHGELMLTTKEDCQATKAAMNKKFEDSRLSKLATLDKVTAINDNVIRIMTYLQIEGVITGGLDER